MMALVEVSWEDQFGTRHTSSAKLEDTSPSGACLRVKVPVAIGSAMKVNSYRERFSGTARYCRTDRRDFVVGLQKDKNVNRFPTDIAAPALPPSVPARNAAIAAAREAVHEDVREEVLDTPREENNKRAELPRESQNPPVASARSRATLDSRHAQPRCRLCYGHQFRGATNFQSSPFAERIHRFAPTGSIPVSIASIRKSKGKGKHGK